jgi:tetratricopeptide (TPR) repeat protein
VAHSEKLQQQWALMDQRGYRRAAAQTELLVSQLHGTDHYDATRLLGRAYYYLGDYEASATWYQQACQGSSDSGDWLDLAIVAAWAGRKVDSGEAFAQVRLCQQAAKYAQPPGLFRQLLWYADSLVSSGDLEAVWPLLDELARAYRHLGASDTVSLYAASMPFMSTFLDLVQRAWRKAGRTSEGKKWLENLAEGLDSEGAKKTRAFSKRLDGG